MSNKCKHIRYTAFALLGPTKKLSAMNRIEYIGNEMLLSLIISEFCQE